MSKEQRTHVSFPTDHYLIDGLGAVHPSGSFDPLSPSAEKGGLSLLVIPVMHELMSRFWTGLGGIAGIMVWAITPVFPLPCIDLLPYTGDGDLDAWEGKGT